MNTKNIFRAYDIRGTWPDEINDDVAYAVGRAFVEFLKSGTSGRHPEFISGSQKQSTEILNQVQGDDVERRVKKSDIQDSIFQILVSRDMRQSSEPLSEALVRGLTDAGADVIDMGLSTSPMHYFAINHLNLDGGIMVTASHNPAQYNGFKVSLAGAVSVGENSGLKEIEQIIAFKSFDESADQEKGIVIKKSLVDDYIDFLIKGRKINRKIKLVVDAGNGMTGLLLPKLFEKLGILNYKPLYFDLDGKFPNHEADPLKEETLEDLKREVVGSGADLGVAFDGDGDRVGFVTSKGKAVRGDFITALLAEEILKDNPGAKIVLDLRSSRAARELISNKGGLPILGKVGRVNIKEQLAHEQALFGGELSMHYYFHDFFGSDAGIFAMIKILELLNEEGKSLGDLIEPLEKYYQSGEVNFVVMEDKVAKMNEVEQVFGDGNVSHLDGLTVEYSDWWFNLRLSNTEPLIRLNIEANSQRLLDEKKKILEKLIIG